MHSLKFKFPIFSSLVSLKEMYSILWENPKYQIFRNFHLLKKPASFEGYEMPYDLPWEISATPLLYSHIVAEQLYEKGEKWTEGFPHDYFHVGLLLRLAKLWMNPYTWEFDLFDDDKIIIDGRIAKEKYCSARFKTVQQMIHVQQVQYLLDFSDEYPICEEDEPQHGSIKGLHYWSMLTWNLDPLFDKILDGNNYSDEEFAATKSYDAAYLRKNLSIIATHRGGKRAAELLRDLQKEWKRIKIWKSDTENMSEKDMQQFELTLFHGFDDLLEEWEDGINTPKVQPKTPKKGKNQSIIKSQSFDSLLQCPKEQKEHVMSRLHDLLDNKGGKHVAIILMAAKQKYSLLIDIPTENQYTSEFALSGSWRAVTNYIKKHTLINGKYSEVLDHISII